MPVTYPVVNKNIYLVVDRGWLLNSQDVQRFNLSPLFTCFFELGQFNEHYLVSANKPKQQFQK